MSSDNQKFTLFVFIIIIIGFKRLVSVFFGNHNHKCKNRKSYEYWSSHMKVFPSEHQKNLNTIYWNNLLTNDWSLSTFSFLTRTSYKFCSETKQSHTKDLDSISTFRVFLPINLKKEIKTRRTEILWKEKSIWLSFQNY